MMGNCSCCWDNLSHSCWFSKACYLMRVNCIESDWIRMLIKSSAYHLDPSSHQTWNTPTITDWLQKKGLYLSDAETSTACRLVTPAKSWSLCLTVKNTTSHRTTSKIWFLHGVFIGVVPLLKLFQITLLLLQSDGLTLVTLLCLPKLIHVMCWVYSRPGTVH